MVDLPTTALNNNVKTTVLADNDIDATATHVAYQTKHHMTRAEYKQAVKAGLIDKDGNVIYMNKDAKQLPQTGDADDTKAETAGIIGVAAAGVLSIFGLAKGKKKHNN